MKLRIKEICKEKGILQKELAEKIGVTDIALRASLKGNPTIGTLEKVANALNVRVTELFEEPTNISGYIEIDGIIKKVTSKDDIQKIADALQ